MIDREILRGWLVSSKESLISICKLFAVIGKILIKVIKGLVVMATKLVSGVQTGRFLI